MEAPRADEKVIGIETHPLFNGPDIDTARGRLRKLVCELPAATVLELLRVAEEASERRAGRPEPRRSAGRSAPHHNDGEIPMEAGQEQRAAIEAFWARRRIEWEARWPSVGPAAIEAFWARFPGREVPDGGPCVWVDLDGYAVGGATPLDALRRSCELWIETWVESAEHAGDLDEIAANLCQGVLEGGPVFLAGDPRHVAALLERAGADIPDMPDR